VIDAARGYLEVLGGIGVDAPYYMLSFLNVRGRRLWTRSPIGQKHAKPILENELLPPEVLCDAAEAAVPSMLRPALETLWHSGGLLGSPNYDGKGDWAPRDDC